MSIKPAPQSNAGWTLVEVMVAAGVFSISGLALATIFLFSIRSFAAMANYADLDENNRQAMDQLTAEIRQARAVVNSTTNSITLLNGNNQSVTYYFNPQNQQFVRSVAGGASKVLLRDCSLIQFGLYQRNPVGGSYNVYPIATGNWTNTVKVVQLTWKTSRTLNTGAVNSENVQTARVVIRKSPNS